MTNAAVKTVWLDFNHWECGDGCCSESFYNAETSDGFCREFIDKTFLTKDEIVDYLNTEFPQYTIDWKRCNMAWYSYTIGEKDYA